MRKLPARWTLAPALLFALFAIQSCGGGGSEPSAVATSVTVAPATVALAVGETRDLTATALDAQNAPITRPRVTWSSSNETVATVSRAGLVKAIADGNATITAKVNSVEATVPVTVQAPVASITVTPATNTLRVGAAPLQLLAEAKNNGGTVLTGRTFEWSSSAPTIATVSATGEVTAVAAGSATISAKIGTVSGTAAVTASVDACTTTQTVTIGQITSGTLAAGDCKLSDSTAVKRYAFTVTAPTKVEIVMTSTAVDAYLFLADSALTVLDQDDDGDGGTNARIVQSLQPGRYIVLANAFAANTFGAFQLVVRTAPTACVTGRQTAIPSSTPGTLATTSCRLPDGSYEDRYDIRVTSRSNVAINMTSTVIDPIVVVVDSADGVLVQDDDGGTGTNARLEVLLEPGRYTILARGYPTQVGAYQLAVAAVVDPCGVNRTLTVPQTVNSTFATTDCALSDGGGPARFLQRYGLTVTTQASVQLDMSSTVVDALLLLQNAQTGDVIAQNDDVSETNTNARIVINLAPGQYIVNATTFDAGEVGAYTLVSSGIQQAGVNITVTPPTVSLTPGQTQQATSAVTGSANTAVTWQSSAPAVATVTTTGLIRALTAGTATITATSQADPARTATVAVTVTTSPTATNLDIAALYLVQSVQQLDGRIPLIADRAAVARVFLRGSRTGLASATVRVRIQQGGTVIGTYTGTAVPTLSVDEGCCSANVNIPATVMRPGISVLADIDPDNTVAESNETDNQFPLTGTPQALSVTAVRPMNIRLVPVQQNRGGVTGVANNSLLNSFRTMWPLSTINVTVRQPLVIDYTIGAENFDDWIRLVRDVEVARKADQSTSYYYGLVRTSGTRGVLGLANGIPALTAIGIDEGTPFGAAESQLTFAHEMGHVMSLRHSPCGNAAGPEPTYPFPDGRTGSYGMDTFNGNVIKPPTTSDVMSYCSPQWVSAFNYRKVFDYRQSTTGTSSPAPSTSVLLVSGGITRGSVTLDPAFTLTAAEPAKNAATGRYEIVAYAADNSVLLTWRFDPYTVSDASEGLEAFVVAVPVSADVQSRIARLAVRDRSGGAQAVRLNTRSQTGIAGGVAVSTSRLPSNGTRLEWSTTQVPAIMIRNRSSGEIVALVRSGAIDLSQFGTPAQLELLLSNGVGSSTVRMSAAGEVQP